MYCATYSFCHEVLELYANLSLTKNCSDPLEFNYTWILLYTVSVSSDTEQINGKPKRNEKQPKINALKFPTHIGSDVNLLPFLKKRVDDTNMTIPRSSMDASRTSLEQC